MGQALLVDPGLELDELLAGGAGACGASRGRGRRSPGQTHRRDVDALQPQHAALEPGVGLGQLHLAGPQALHLAAVQDEAALHLVEDGVVVASLPVGGDELAAWGGRRHGALRVAATPAAQP